MCPLFRGKITNTVWLLSLRSKILAKHHLPVNWALAAQTNIEFDIHIMKAINMFCPRSGKPVQEDSLTEYKGHIVGFCNPGCRDDFRENVSSRPNDTKYFDVVLKEKINR